MWHWLLLRQVADKIVECMTTSSVSRFIVETKCGESTDPIRVARLSLYLVYPATEGETLSQWPAGSSVVELPNFNPEVHRWTFEKRHQASDFISDGKGDLKKTFGPEDVFHYIYAVLHSPEYRRRYADFMKSDFPRISLPRQPCVVLRLSCSPRRALGQFAPDGG